MEDRQLIAVVLCMLLLVLSLVFVGARLWVRCCMLRNSGMDDLFCILAAAFSIAEMAIMFVEIRYGAGKHANELSTETIDQLRWSVYISIPLYYIGLMFIKLSIIYQYLRFFRDTLGRLCYLTLALVVCTTITWLCISIFQCHPVRGVWHSNLEGSKCLDLTKINYSYLAVNAATDILLLVLPMPSFYRLKLGKAEKRALIGIFALGGFAALTSFIRIPNIVRMAHGGDHIYHGFGLVVWTRVELFISIICACLPCLRVPLAKRFPRVWGTEHSSLTTSPNSIDTSTPRPWSKIQAHARRLSDRCLSEKEEDRGMGMVATNIARAPLSTLLHTATATEFHAGSPGKTDAEDIRMGFRVSTAQGEWYVGAPPTVRTPGKTAQPWRITSVKTWTSADIDVRAATME